MDTYYYQMTNLNNSRKPSLHSLRTDMQSECGYLMCSFCTASSENELNHKLENTLVAMVGMCSLPKTNTESKTNIMYHNRTFGGFKSVVVLYASHLQLLTLYKLTIKKMN